MTRTLFRFAAAALACGPVCFTLCGCGSATTNTPTAAVRDAAASSTTAEDGVVPATDVVSQFLDQIRRGGEDSGAGELLTAQAQSELQRIGRSVQPIGTPDASFEVTRGEPVPEDPAAMLVHSIWREPGADGSHTDSQVVWALRKENAAWRISGLAMEFEPGQDPLVINFEDGDLMQAILGGEEVSQSGEQPAAQATLPTEIQSR